MKPVDEKKVFDLGALMGQINHMRDIQFLNFSLLCSFALGHVAAPFLSLAQGLLVAGQMLLVALVLRLRVAP